MSKANILTIFFASALIFVFITLPVSSGFLREKRILNEKKEDFRDQEQYFEELKKLNLTLNDYNSELKMINSAISDNSIIPSLVYYLKRSVENNGLFFDNIKSVLEKEPERFPDFKELELSFLVTGSYPNFKNFLKTLENSIKIIEIKDFSISSDPEEESGDLLLYDLTVKTYLY